MNGFFLIIDARTYGKMIFRKSKEENAKIEPLPQNSPMATLQTIHHPGILACIVIAKGFPSYSIYLTNKLIIIRCCIDISG